MRSIGRLLVVAGTVVALIAVAPSALATSPSSGALHVTKECSQYTRLADSFCTITSSNLKAIGVGSRVIYLQALDPLRVPPVLDSDVVLDPPGPGNNIAFGHCTLPLPAGPGLCTFSGGTGKFTRFHARVVVTPQSSVVRGWHWDGSYSFGSQADGNAENTFTKWVTAFPNVAGDVADMAGVVGGDVGKGSYAGVVLKDTPGTTEVIEALYQFKGSRHSFTALVHVEQTGLKAVISGVVTDGWLKGHQVKGKYTQINCKQGLGGLCFRGTLDIIRGSSD